MISFPDHTVHNANVTWDCIYRKGELDVIINKPAHCISEGCLGRVREVMDPKGARLGVLNVGVSMEVKRRRLGTLRFGSGHEISLSYA